MPAHTLRLDDHGPAVTFLDADEEPRREERLLRVRSAHEGVGLVERISPAAARRETLLSLLEPELGFGTSRMSDRDLHSAAGARLVDGRLRAVELPAVRAITAAGQSYRVLQGSERPRRGESPMRFFDREGAGRFLEQIGNDPWGRPALHEAAYRSTGRARGEPAAEVLERFAEQIAAGRVQVVRIAPAGGVRVPGALPPAAAQTGGARAAAPRLQLCEIPEVMERVYGWTIAPRLMRSWFQRPVYEMREAVKDGEVDPARLAPAVLELSLVRMDWVLRHPPARAAYDAFVRGSWITPRGQERLASQIMKEYRTQQICTLSWRFGNLGASTPVVDSRYQVNIAPVESGVNDTIDEWYGAMGAALLKVAVAGQVTHRVAGRIGISVDEIGIYLRDTYDFNDNALFSQPLGAWSRTGVSKAIAAQSIAIDQAYGAAPAAAGATEAPGTRYNVRNDDFREYRDRHRKGGDFVIFSNVARVRLPRPVVLDLAMPRS